MEHFRLTEIDNLHKNKKLEKSLEENKIMIILIYKIVLLTVNMF